MASPVRLLHRVQVVLALLHSNHSGSKYANTTIPGTSFLTGSQKKESRVNYRHHSGNSSNGFTCAGSLSSFLFGFSSFWLLLVHATGFPVPPHSYSHFLLMLAAGTHGFLR